MSRTLLLLIDAIINLVLGVVLAFFPGALIALIGAPPGPHAFYVSIFGAVLFGIGIALLLQVRAGPGRPGGLGLAGAVAINLCGAVVLGWWLLFGGLHLPARGQVLLWVFFLILLLLSFIEAVRGDAVDRA